MENNAVWPTLSACERPQWEMFPPTGFSSLVYLTVANTKPHAPYVKQDLREFLIVIFAFHRRSTPLHPDFSGH